MTFTSIFDLDAPMIEELVSDIDNNVLDSILCDSTFGDKQFLKTVEMFNGTLDDRPVILSNKNLSNYTEADIEASLKPINFDDSIETPFDARYSLETEKLPKKRESTKANVNSHQNVFADHSYTAIIKTNESSIKNNNSCDFAHHGLPPASEDTKISPPILETSIDSNSVNGFKSKLESQCINKHSSPASTRAKIKKSRSAPLCSRDGNKYQDRSMMTDQEAIAHIHYDSLRGCTKELFPVKLHKIIECSERHGFSSIISWMLHGRSFKIHNKGGFTSEVIPYFFYQSKMSSFARQLRMHGFHKIKGKSNVDRGAYFHELFLHSRPGLSHSIIRLDKPCSLSKKDKPSFYLFHPMPSTCGNSRQKSKADVTPRCMCYSNYPPMENSVRSNAESTNLTTALNNNTISHANEQPGQNYNSDSSKSSTSTTTKE